MGSNAVHTNSAAGAGIGPFRRPLANESNERDSMDTARTEDVKQLYERYPYPRGSTNAGPDFAFTYFMRIHFLPSDLAGLRILDAGCGTGHKLVALAITYPKASFVGVDLSEQSLEVARALAERTGVRNVELRQGSFPEMTFEEKFDFIQSIGVIHHLENPQKGLDNLTGALKEDGFLSTWLYHPFGEFDRLRQRELLLTLWGKDRTDMAEGQALMEALGLELKPQHYGPREKDADNLEGNADAYMHPIVNAYRFDEAFDMLKAAGNRWAAVDFLNLKGALKFVNLEEVKDHMVGHLCVRPDDLLASGMLHDRYRRLPVADRLKVIELALQPTGFLTFSGKGESFVRLSERIRGNLIHFR
jgi:SAM-dependent methyltransferase